MNYEIAIWISASSQQPKWSFNTTQSMTGMQKYWVHPDMAVEFMFSVIFDNPVGRVVWSFPE